MARDRQRSKQRQRQQQRREERLARRREPAPGDGAAASRAPEPAADPDLDDARELEDLADLEVGAPPEDVGTSSRTLRDEPPAPSFDTDDETLGDEALDAEAADATAAGPRGVRGARESRDGGDQRKRGRVIAFLVAVWAELQRVQWPDRRQLTQLTGVVLFFVLIVGLYLGGLDAVFSKLIQAIL
jgi:preprotein translocase subunit SecE